MADYIYREAICPFCEHKFMYSNAERTNAASFFDYHFAENSESLFVAKCPECNKEMALLKSEIKGIPTDDRRLVKSRFYGI